MRNWWICLFWMVWGQYAASQPSLSVQEALANYEYETALQLISRTSSLTLPLLYQKGTALKGLGRTAEALAVYQEALRLDSLRPRACIEAAECCRLLARYREALSYYRQALTRSPHHKYARLRYIDLLLAQKHYQQALSESEQLMREDSSAYVLHLRAESLKYCCGPEDANRVVEAYRQIHERFPDDFLAVAQLGNIYIARRQYAEAVAITEAYRRIDSVHVAVNRINAQAYCLQQDYPAAAARYRQLLHNGDSTFHTLFYAGVSQYALGQFYESHDLLLKALESDSTNVNLLYYLGRSCAKTSWKKEGVRYLEKAVRLSVPSDSAMSQLYSALADCYQMNAQYARQAATLLEQYYTYDRQKSYLLYKAAQVYYYRLKDPANTEKCLRAYLKTRPEDLEQEVDASGIPVLGEYNRYKAAEAWLEDLRKDRRTEEFFQGKLKE